MILDKELYTPEETYEMTMKTLSSAKIRGHGIHTKEIGTFFRMVL